MGSEIRKQLGRRAYTDVPKPQSQSIQQKGEQSVMLVFTGDKNDPIIFNPDFVEEPHGHVAASQIDAIETSLQTMGLSTAANVGQTQALELSHQPIIEQDADVNMQPHPNPTDEIVKAPSADAVAVLPPSDQAVIPQADQALVEEDAENIEFQRVERARNGQPLAAQLQNFEPRRSRNTPPVPRSIKFVEKPALFQGKQFEEFLKNPRPVVPRASVEPLLDYGEEDEYFMQIPPVTRLSDEIKALFQVNTSQDDEEDPPNVLIPDEQPTRPPLDILSVVDVVPPLDAEAISNLMGPGICVSQPDLRPCKFLF